MENIEVYQCSECARFFEKNDTGKCPVCQSDLIYVKTLKQGGGIIGDIETI